MPKEEGIIIKVSPEGALVRVKKTDACCSCPSNRLCHVGSIGERDVLAKNPIGAEEGQRVEIEVEDGLLLKASCIIYLFPVIGLLIGGLIGRWIVNIMEINIAQDTGSVIGGLTCMIFVFLIIKIVTKRDSFSKRYQPTIIKIR